MGRARRKLGGALCTNGDKSPVGGHWVRPSWVGVNRAAVGVMWMPSAAIARASNWVNSKGKVGDCGDGSGHWVIRQGGGHKARLPTCFMLTDSKGISHLPEGWEKNMWINPY